MANVPYELTVSVQDLEQARRFYVDVLGGREDGSGRDWTSVSFYGNRLTLQQRKAPLPADPSDADSDGSSFGVVVPREHFTLLLERLEAAQVDIVRRPVEITHDSAGLAFIDPNGHSVEIKPAPRLS